MDKLKKIIEKQYQSFPQSITYLEQGLTNDNYLLDFGDAKHVIRLPKIKNKNLFDYNLESEILELIKDSKLDVPTLYYNADSGIKITEFVENADHYKRKYLIDATLMIRKLHDFELKSGRNYDIVATFEKYKKYDHEPLFDTTFAQNYLYKARKLSKDFNILCHNDLVEGNFLFTKNKNYIIDYEYAMDNHPFFDLMSFITENDIQNEDDRELIYKTYFDKEIDQKTRSQLLIFEIAHHVLWCEWASYMFHQKYEKIYYDIAKLKYTRLKEVLNKKSK